MKKFAAILCLLVLLTSCGGDKSDNKDVNNDNQNIEDNVGGETNTGGAIIDIDAEGELNEEEILEDIDNLLNDIINSTEDGSGATASGETASWELNTDAE